MSLWSCTTCSKSFSRKGDLTRHNSLHTGIKPHICETCGKGFAQISALKTHRNVHSKARPYICGIGSCTKAFGDPSSRTRHRKETHRCEGVYKCIITGCGTRIKRRSGFVAHLRKHGLDPNSLDVDVVALQSSGSRVLAPAHFASPARENKCHREVESRSCGHYTLEDNGEASYLMNNNAWLDDDPLDCQRAGWSANDALLSGSILDRTADVGLSDDIYPHLPSDFKHTFYFDGIFPTTVDCSLLAVSPLNLPVLEPSLEAGSDGSQSSSTSPLSAYSALYTTDFSDDAASLFESRESLLYDIM